MQLFGKGLLFTIYKQIVTFNENLSSTFKMDKFKQKLHKWKYTSNKQAYEKMSSSLLIREMPIKITKRLKFRKLITATTDEDVEQLELFKITVGIVKRHRFFGK